ncbi:MAG: GGDEF domain-containing protein [Desulforhopalus sp.]
MATSPKNELPTGPTHDKIELGKVLAELDRLKKQSERLARINELHVRMSGVLSLTGMIEAYSIWLMPLAGHSLIGYNNSGRRKRHLFCSNHGPGRRAVMAFAERLLKDDVPLLGGYAESEGRYAYKWIFESAEDAAVLLIIKEERPLSHDELDIVNHSLEILAECLFRGLEYEDLFERASHDPLTGLANRRVFDERLPVMMESARRYHHPLTMISMDLDHFKEINDNLGHQRGDDTLKAVADVLKKTVRSVDLLVRMGGDEFLLVLENTDLQRGKVLAERLCRAVDDLDIRATDKVKLGVSIGLSELAPEETLQQWLERTDDILYHAKAKGRSRVAAT